MGCDIHLYVERRENGKWVPVADKIPNERYGEDYDQYGTETVSQFSKSTWDEKYPDEFKGLNNVFYQGRNYNLFAILANVRNGHGFAGVPTGKGFEPISMPRGLPDDVSQEVKRISDYWGIDGHSHSWLAARELLEFDYKGQTTESYAIVTKGQYKQFLKTDKPPQRYAAGVWGLNIRVVDNAEIMDTPYDDGIEYYTRIAWPETYREAVGEHVFATLMANLKALSDLDNVRIVFWFDN
jgi:hypothetical protein